MSLRAEKLAVGDQTEAQLIGPLLSLLESCRVRPCVFRQRLGNYFEKHKTVGGDGSPSQGAWREAVTVEGAPLASEDADEP